MFGHNNDQTTVGPATVQNPSMLDNVSSGDFEEGAHPAVTEVEKQVKEALAQHDLKQVEQTVTNDSSGNAPADGALMTSGSDAPSAVPATSDNSSADDSSSDDSSGDENAAPVATAEEPAIVSDDESKAEVESVTPQPLTAPAPDHDEDSLENTIPGIKVEEASPPVQDQEPEADTTTAQDSEEASPSAPIAPPAVPDGVQEEVVVEPPAAEEQPTEEAEPAPEVAAVVDEVAASVAPVEPSEPPVEAAIVDEAAPEEEPQAPRTPEEATEPVVTARSVPEVDTTKLAGLKQHALDHLEPLADKLDQSPEEEFKTTMMRIQANDNHTLLEKALAAAKNIPDDKARAQAILDIVNEINYFSQSQ